MSRRAFSLLETLMVASLLLTMLGLVTQILLPVIRSYAKYDRRSLLQQRVAIALDKLEAEIADSNVRGLHFYESPQRAVVVQPLGIPGPRGVPFWSPEMRVFLARNRELRFYVWRSTELTRHPIGRPFALLEAMLPGVLSAPEGANQLLLSSLEIFEVRGLEPEQRQLPLQIRVGARLATGEQFELTREVAPRARVSR